MAQCCTSACCSCTFALQKHTQMPIIQFCIQSHYSRPCRMTQNGRSGFLLRDAVRVTVVCCYPTSSMIYSLGFDGRASPLRHSFVSIEFALCVCTRCSPSMDSFDICFSFSFAPNIYPNGVSKYAVSVTMRPLFLHRPPSSASRHFFSVASDGCDVANVLQNENRTATGQSVKFDQPSANPAQCSLYDISIEFGHEKLVRRYTQRSERILIGFDEMAATKCANGISSMCRLLAVKIERENARHRNSIPFCLFEEVKNCEHTSSSVAVHFSQRRW